MKKQSSVFLAVTMLLALFVECSAAPAAPANSTAPSGASTKASSPDAVSTEVTNLTL